MAITYYMLQFPPVLFFLFITVICGSIAGIGTALFRKYSKLEILRSHNEVAGFLFLAIAGFYSLLLSFMVFLVWGELNETKNNLNKEGSSALALYRDIKYYPDTTDSKQMMIVYLDYVFNVVDDEMPNMRQMKQSIKTGESLNNIFFQIERIHPKTPFETQLLTEMFRHLNELSVYRGLRTGSLEMEIPPPIWLPLLFGALITVLCSIVLDIEHTRLHISLNILLGSFIGMVLFIIILLDHPFTGSFSVNSKSYNQIFILEQRADTLYQANTNLTK